MLLLSLPTRSQAHFLRQRSLVEPGTDIIRPKVRHARFQFGVGIRLFGRRLQRPGTRLAAAGGDNASKK